MTLSNSEIAEPVGWFASGEPYFAPIGAVRYDGDRVQCHLCGRWLKMVGGSHLLPAHEMTLTEYRELFKLYETTTTAAPETTARKRRTMLEQIATGEREQPVSRPSAPTVGRWRSLGARRADLLREWHPTRNGDLDAFAIGVHSHRKLWWRCGECGHEWPTSPNSRTSSGQGCPACGRRRSIAATIERNRAAVPPVERSLAVVRPDLLAEWHPTANGDLDPRRLAAGSEVRVWWRCGNDGCRNEWTALVCDRSKRPSFGYPGCAHRHAGLRRARAESDRSLGALHPQLLDECGIRRVTASLIRLRSNQVPSCMCGGDARIAVGSASAAAIAPAQPTRRLPDLRGADRQSSQAR